MFPRKIIAIGSYVFFVNFEQKFLTPQKNVYKNNFPLFLCVTLHVVLRFDRFEVGEGLATNLPSLAFHTKDLAYARFKSRLTTNI